MDHPVALFDPGDSHFNTIALHGIDVVIPLEEDLDCDPLQDDEIRLLSLDGGVEKILKASDADATPDHDRGLIYYHFRCVPPGFYKISVLIGATWSDVSHQLLVSPKGVWLAGKRLSPQEPPVSFDVRKDARKLAAARPAPTQMPRYIDVNKTFWDREA